MLDSDLALLYGIPTKALKQQVRRNIKRFSQDFMPAGRTGRFELSKTEFGIKFRKSYTNQY